MNIIVHRQVPADETLRERWDQLVREMDQPEVFYTYEWAFAVAHAYGDSRSPLLVMAFIESSLVGVVALATLSDRKVHFLCASTADYCDFVCAAKDHEKFVTAVFWELGKMKVGSIVLANLPAESPTQPLLQASRSKLRCYSFAQLAYQCGQVQLASQQEKQSVRELLRHKKSLRRDSAALARMGELRVVHLKTPERVSKIMPAFFRAHVARFLASGRISNIADPARQAFLAELGQQLANAGWMKFSCLMAGDRQIAWNYGFEFAGSWFWYQPTFDGTYGKHFPGFCLLGKMVEEACEREDVERIDLGLGDENYKDRLATGSRQTLHVAISSALTAHIKAFLRYHIARTIKLLPLLENSVRKILGGHSRLTRRFREAGFMGGLKWLGQRFSTLVFEKQEVTLFEWMPRGQDINEDDQCVLQPLNLDLLARAAISYVSEPDTMTYLLRSAGKLKTAAERGFVLTNEAGTPLHIGWVADFNGYHLAELDCTVDGQTPDSTVIVDCWTPIAARGRGFYVRAVKKVAAQLCAEGRKPWIFSAPANKQCIRGIERAGFQRRFGLARRRWFRLSTPVQSQPYANWDESHAVISVA